jgi:hypothetical protein
MTKKKQIPEDEPDFVEEKYWGIYLGFYPGILFGFRTYEEVGYSTHVLYIPFINIALEIDN